MLINYILFYTLFIFLCENYQNHLKVTQPGSNSQVRRCVQKPEVWCCRTTSLHLNLHVRKHPKFQNELWNKKLRTAGFTSVEFLKESKWGEWHATFLFNLAFLRYSYCYSEFLWKCSLLKIISLWLLGK